MGIHVAVALGWPFMLYAQTFKTCQAFRRGDIYDCCGITPQRSIKGLFSAARLHGIIQDSVIKGIQIQCMATKAAILILQKLNLHCTASWNKHVGLPFLMTAVSHSTIHACCSKSPAQLLLSQLARLSGLSMKCLAYPHASHFGQRLAVACKVKEAVATSTLYFIRF